jgi:hypothetical protein
MKVSFFTYLLDSNCKFMKTSMIFIIITSCTNNYWFVYPRAMPPNQLGNSLFLSETNSAEPVQIISKQELPQSKSYVRSTKPQYRWQIVWRNVLIFIYLHVTAIFGIYYMFTLMQWRTFVWGESV